MQCHISALCLNCKYFNVETRKEVKFFLYLILQDFLGVQYYAMKTITTKLLSASKHKQLT
jgi:hypothetical protein